MIGAVCGLAALAVILIPALLAVVRPELYAKHTGTHVRPRRQPARDADLTATPSQAYRTRLRAAVVARQQAVAALDGSAG